MTWPRRTRTGRPERGTLPSVPDPILTVCTANVCRSPFLERVLQGALRRGPGPARDLVVGSAGVRAHEGVEPPPVIAKLVTAHGGNAEGMSSTPLTADHVARAGLILTATREHRSAVVRLHRRGLRTAFTMREFARLLDGLELPDRNGQHLAPDLAELVAAAAARRGTLPPLAPGLGDVVDPIGRDLEVYEQAVAQMVPVVDALTAALTTPAAAGR